MPQSTYRHLFLPQWVVCHITNHYEMRAIFKVFTHEQQIMQIHVCHQQYKHGINHLMKSKVAKVLICLNHILNGMSRNRTLYSTMVKEKTKSYIHNCVLCAVHSIITYT